MIHLLFGLHGFWNRDRRRAILDMIASRLDKDWMIEEINWLTAEKRYRDTYSVYVLYCHKTKGFDASESYWSHRRNNTYLFNVVTNTTNFKREESIAEMIDRQRME